MSQQFPPPPPPQSPVQPPLPPGGMPNPYLAMQAAAKANRPWYKKKRFLIPIAVVVLIAIVSGASGSGGDSGTQVASDQSSKTEDSKAPAKKSDEKSEEKAAPAAAEEKEEKAEEKAEPEGEVGTEDNPAPRGKAVQNKSAKYRVDNVEVRDSLGDFSDPPAGKYVVVTVTVENVKDETIQVSSEDFTLLAGGVEIDASDEAFILDGAFSYDDLSPGLKRTGKVVFDVIPKNAGKGVLKAQAMLSLDEPLYLNLQK